MEEEVAAAAGDEAEGKEGEQEEEEDKPRERREKMTNARATTAAKEGRNLLIDMQRIGKSRISWPSFESMCARARLWREGYISYLAQCV